MARPHRSIGDDLAVRLPVAFLICASVLIGCGDGDATRTDQQESPALRVVSDWVQALNDRDWSRACELSAGPEGWPCDELLAAAFADHEAEISVEGAYFARGAEDGEGMTFSLADGPAGFSAGRVDRQEGELVVHWEAQIIR